MRDGIYASKQVSFGTDMEAAVYRIRGGSEQSRSTHWGFIQVNRGSKGIHQS